MNQVKLLNYLADYIVKTENTIVNDLESKLAELQRIANKSENEIEKEAFENNPIETAKDKELQFAEKTVEEYDKLFASKVGEEFDKGYTLEEDDGDSNIVEESEDNTSYQQIREKYAQFLENPQENDPNLIKEEQFEDSLDQV